VTSSAYSRSPPTGSPLARRETAVTIFPAKHTVTTKDKIESILPKIKEELDERLKYFKEDLCDVLKFERLKTKVEYDMEMMQEV